MSSRQLLSTVASLVKVGVASCLDLAYPPLCMHCQERGIPLCPACLETLTEIDSDGACQVCLSAEAVDGICRNCRGVEPILDGLSAAFDGGGAILTLLREFKKNQRFWLADGLAAYMLMNMMTRSWPMPDLVTYVPRAIDRSLAGGYHAAELLAESLGTFLNRPVRATLTRRIGGYKQSLQTDEARRQLSPDRFSLKRHAIEDKVLLLVDDTVRTGMTLHCSAMALAAGYPAKIFGLALCRI